MYLRTTVNRTPYKLMQKNDSFYKSLLFLLQLQLLINKLLNFLVKYFYKICMIKLMLKLI